MGRWRNLVRRYARLHPLLRVGLAWMAVGGAGDVIYHGFGSQAWPERLSYLLHLLTFAGMAVAVVGILVEASSGT